MSLVRTIIAAACLAVLAGTAISHAHDAPEASADRAAPEIYIAVGGAQQGPMTLEQFAADIQAGRITRETLVWTPGQGDWIAAGDHPVLGQQFVVTTPPPPPPPAEFYYEQGGQSVGPLTLAALTDLIRKGTVTGQTLVWKQGGAAWVAAAEVPELKAVFAGLPPPAAPGGDFKRYMIGTWEFSTSVGDGVTLTTTIQYSADGSYSGNAKFEKVGANAMSETLSGTWAVQAVNADTFALTFTPTGATAQVVQMRKINDNLLENITEGGQARRVG